jgi:molybdate transport system substrate-binding protein
VRRRSQGQPRRAAAWACPALVLLVAVMAACWAHGADGRPGGTVAGDGPGGNPAGDGASGGGRNEELVVYAAASLTQVFSELGKRYEARQPQVRVILSFDSSASLRARVEQGAPADVLAAADAETPRRLLEAGLATGEVVVFARNRLAIVVPSDNPAGIQSPSDLARTGVRLVAAGEEVPITRYVGRLLERLAVASGAPAGFVERVQRNVVSREDNVRAVLAKVELGEADAGIVYATDARSSPRVRTIAIPESANVSATYGAVAVGRSANAARAREFVGWLVHPEAQAVLVDAGFLPGGSALVVLPRVERGGAGAG